MNNRLPECSFYGCYEYICKEDEVIEQHMKFCQKHHDELESYVTAQPFSPAKIISFWIRANGGAKRMAEKF